MNDLQALVTGMILGALMSADGNLLEIDVRPEDDGAGNYLPRVHVVGRVSGTHLLVEVSEQ